MFLSAAYNVTDGPNNIVQWLDLDNHPYGAPFVGTAQALSNIPPSIIFEDLSNRELDDKNSLALLIPYPVQSPVPTQLFGQDSSASVKAVGSVEVPIGRAVFTFSSNNHVTLESYFCQNPDGSFNSQCDGPDPTLHLDQQINATVLCYAENVTTRTVWFSAHITGATADFRQSASSNQGTLSYWAQGYGIMYGEFIDTNGDGFADKRSIITSAVDIPVGNYDTQTGDLGTGNLPRVQDPATFCQWRDGMFLTVNYNITNGPSNVLHWINAYSRREVGPAFVGTAAALLNWPLEALYNNLGYRQLDNGTSLALYLV